MAIGKPVQELITAVGHDGGEITSSHSPEPSCRRGFHSQEIIDVLWRWGFACTPIELYPVLANPEHMEVYFPKTDADNLIRFKKFIDTTTGVITGATKYWHHAVAYDHGRIFDPDGYTYKYDHNVCARRGFFTRQLFVITTREVHEQPNTGAIRNPT